MEGNELPLATPTPAAGPIPWEDPEVPRLTGLLRTLWQVMRRPGEFFRGMPRAGAAEALGFGLIVGTLGLLATMYWQWLVLLNLSRQLGQNGMLNWVLQLSSGAMAITIILTPAIALLSLAVSTLALWAALAMLGGGASGAFTPLWRINNYAQGPMVLALIPIVGGMAAGLWVLVLLYLGMQRVFSLSSGRSVAVVLIALVLQTLSLFLLLGGMLLLSGLGLGFIRI